MLTAVRLARPSDLLDRVCLWTGIGVLAATSLTGHAIDDTLPLYTQLSFLLHTAAGLTWFGGLFALIWWMYSARGKPPEVARQLAERWSFVAKIAMAIVVVSGVVLAWETVGSFPNLLATPYGRLLTIKLVSLSAVLLVALALARYITREPTGSFDTLYYSRVGAVEGVFGVALLFLAGWIAVINPASHETDLYWPLPFRLSWAATWGFKVPPVHADVVAGRRRSRPARSSSCSMVRAAGAHVAADRHSRGGRCRRCGAAGVARGAGLSRHL